MSHDTREPKMARFFTGDSITRILENIPSGLFLVDRNQKITYWNREAERITGFPAGHALGKHCSFLDGVPCGEFCGLFARQLPKPVIGVTCTIRTRSGRRITLLKNMDYLRDEAGSIIGGVESFIDVTPFKKLEKRLRRQAFDLEHAVQRRTAELENERTQLRNVLDAMRDFAYITSADHRVQFMNRAMIATFGDHIGESCHIAFHDLTEPCGECPMPEVLKGNTVRDERWVKSNNRTYEIIHTPLEAADGQVHKLAVYRDITERKEAEEEILEANRELDAFVYTVSHDLRTPLTPIIGYADHIAQEYGHRLDEQGLEMLREIAKQGHKMLALMEDLLELARVGRLAPPEQPPEVAPIVHAVLDELSELIREQGAEVTVGPLPHLSIPETMLAQIFSNLIGNALRYAAGPGSPIEIGGSIQRDKLLFHVRDHGPGIPADERQSIFNPFHRGSTAGKTVGTGIGLATVRKIVRLYGGRVWVDETPGGGSTFRMEFPRQPIAGTAP